MNELTKYTTQTQSNKNVPEGRRGKEIYFIKYFNAT
jgi:hypothetical protein